MDRAQRRARENMELMTDRKRNNPAEDGTFDPFLSPNSSEEMDTGFGGTSYNNGGGSTKSLSSSSKRNIRPIHSFATATTEGTNSSRSLGMNLHGRAGGPTHTPTNGSSRGPGASFQRTNGAGGPGYPMEHNVIEETESQEPFDARSATDETGFIVDRNGNKVLNDAESAERMLSQSFRPVAVPPPSHTLDKRTTTALRSPGPTDVLAMPALASNARDKVTPLKHGSRRLSGGGSLSTNPFDESPGASIATNTPRNKRPAMVDEWTPTGTNMSVMTDDFNNGTPSEDVPEDEMLENDSWQQAEAEWKRAEKAELEYNTSVTGSEDAALAAMNNKGYSSAYPTSILKNKIRRAATSKSSTPLNGVKESPSDDDSIFLFDEKARSKDEDEGKEKGAKRTKHPSPKESSSRKGSSRSLKSTTSRKESVRSITSDDTSEASEEDASAVGGRKGGLKKRNSRKSLPSSEASVETEDSDEPTIGESTVASGKSHYSKSMESQVEDVIKDFFFFGSGTHTDSGRRSSRDKKDDKRSKNRSIKRERSRGETDDGDSTVDESQYTYDEATVNTYGERTVNTNEETLQTRSKSPMTMASNRNIVPLKSSASAYTRNSMDDSTQMYSEMSRPSQQGDPLEMIWNSFQGGVGSVSAALGLPNPLTDPCSVENISCINTKEKKEEAATAKAKSDRALKNAPKKTPFEEWVDYAADLLFPTNGTIDEDTMDGTYDTRTYDGTTTLGTDGQTVTNAEKEAGLFELAKCAARAKHHLHNVVFDESVEIDVVNEIKFSVITIALPLGLLFQENSGGCWVTRVFKNGNAANCKGGNGVEVGDQLAGVNGNSTIKMKVDEICTMISESPNPKEIELTFIRYVGAIRPAQNGQARDRYNNGGKFGGRTRKPSMMKWKSNRPTSPPTVIVKNSKVSETAVTKKDTQQKKRFGLFGRKKK